MAKTEYEQALERATGESIRSLRDTPIDVRRKQVEKRTGRPMEFGISKGSRTTIVTRAQLEADLDAALAGE